MGWIVLCIMLACNVFNAEMATRRLQLERPLERLLAGYLMFWAVWIPLVYLAGWLGWIEWPVLLAGQILVGMGLWTATRKFPRKCGASTALGELLGTWIAKPIFPRYTWLWITGLSLPIIAWMSWILWRMVSFPICDWDSASIYAVQLALMMQTQSIEPWEWGFFAVSRRPLNSPAMMLLFTLAPRDFLLIQVFKWTAIPFQAISLYALCRQAGSARGLALVLACVPFTCHSYLSQFDAAVLSDDIIALLLTLAVYWGARWLQTFDRSEAAGYRILLAITIAMLLGFRLRTMALILPLHLLLVIVAGLSCKRQPSSRGALTKQAFAYCIALVVASIGLACPHRYLEPLLAKPVESGGPITAPQEHVDGKYITAPIPDSAWQHGMDRLVLFLIGPLLKLDFHYHFSTHLGLVGSIAMVTAPLLLWSVSRRLATAWRDRCIGPVELTVALCAASALCYSVISFAYHRWENPDGRYYLPCLFLWLPLVVAWLKDRPALQTAVGLFIATTMLLTMGAQPFYSFVAPQWWIARYQTLPSHQRVFATFTQQLSNGHEDLDASYLVETMLPDGVTIGRQSGKTRDFHLFGDRLQRKVLYARDPAHLEQLVATEGIDYVMIHQPFDPLSLWYVEGRRPDNKPAKDLLRHCLAHREKYRLIYPMKNAAPVERREVIFEVMKRTEVATAKEQNVK